MDLSTRNRPAKLTPETPIVGGLDLDVGRFWSWAYSDVLSNRNRAVFAEYLVGAALGTTGGTVRTEWDAYDVAYQGRRIEVKSAAYVQSWKQNGRSQIRFDVSAKRAWYAETNTYDSRPSRVCDCYVFCLFTAIDDAFARVLDTREWEFYPLGKGQIERELGPAKSLALSRLRTMRSPVSWAQLRSAIDETCGC